MQVCRQVRRVWTEIVVDMGRSVATDACGFAGVVEVKNLRLVSIAVTTAPTIGIAPDAESVSVQTAIASQHSAFPVDLIQHHFFFAGVLVCDLKDAEPEILREILATLRMQISDSNVSTMPTIGVVRPSIP